MWIFAPIPSRSCWKSPRSPMERWEHSDKTGGFLQKNRWYSRYTKGIKLALVSNVFSISNSAQLMKLSNTGMEFECQHWGIQVSGFEAMIDIHWWGSSYNKETRYGKHSVWIWPTIGHNLIVRGFKHVPTLGEENRFNRNWDKYILCIYIYNINMTLIQIHSWVIIIRYLI